MKGFTEESLEGLIMDLIEGHGYTHVHGDDLRREYGDVLIEDDLREFLKRRYAENGIETSEVSQIVSSLRSASALPLYEANRDMFRRIVEGETFRRHDPEAKDFHLRLIDFDDVSNNTFKVCNQVIVKGPQQKRIPDAIVYVNGLPLVVFEFKSTVKVDATIFNAFEQVTIRYTRDIPDLFKYNAFVVITDGVNSKMGSVFSDYEHFYAWRKVDADSEAKDGIDSLFTMIDGLFPTERLLSYVRDFVYFPDASTHQVKICASYAQYFAATSLHANVVEHMRPHGDGKGGTYFGTTGCGKSYAMLFLTRLLMRDPRMSSPTIVLVTDRTDLDDQLSQTFVEAKLFIGENDVASVTSREDLGLKLRGRPSGGVYLTTVQKFEEATSLLTDRANIVCISDEAHRSQTNLAKRVKIDRATGEARDVYGYAKFLHDSLPCATYVGFTGTPIDATIDVFGGIVQSYTMRDSIRDGVTVPLVYDGRFAKAVLDTAKLQEIEEYYRECLESGANEYQVEESKKSITMKSIIGDEAVLEKVANNFIEHYESRVREGSTVSGKAMFVCADRMIAWKFYKIVKDKRPDWVVSKPCAEGITLDEDDAGDLVPMPMMKMVMTRGKNDPKELWDMLGTDADRANDAIQFKDERSNFKIAIIVDMWLTGFDVPSLDTMYIDKLLTQPHNIIQSISRVNRAYQGKKSGLIVDFIGIRSGMNLALKKYAKYEEGDVEGIEKAIGIVRDQIEVLDNMFAPFDKSGYFEGTNADRFKNLNKAAEFVQVTKEFEQRFMANVRRMSRAFNLCNASQDFTESELDVIHYYMAVRAIVHKLTKGDAPDASSMNRVVSKMVSDAISADDVEVLFSLETTFDTSGIDLFSEEYMSRINAITLPNTKIKILQQLLKQAIDDFGHVNKIKAMSFSERLRGIVNEYNTRALTDDEMRQMLDDLAERLMDLVDELGKEKESFQSMGINYEEKAFYDILVAVEEKYDFTYPDEENIALARDIYAMVTDKTRYADWANRRDVRAEMQADIIMMLASRGYPQIPAGTRPPEDYEHIYNEVLDQTENFKKYYR